MLANYIEPAILNKIFLINTLLEFTHSDFSELVQITGFSKKTIRELIAELQPELGDLLQIHIDSKRIHCCLLSNATKTQCLQRIYENSLFLQCLRFLLTNQQHLPYTEFIKTHYISVPTAYRLKKRCHHYLETVQLTIKNNYIVGEEFKIRYLLALLQCHFGITCYKITEEDRMLVKEFITVSNDHITPELLVLMEEELLFFEFLIILTWKRHVFRPFLPASRQFDALKKIFIYQLIRTYSEQVFEPHLQLKFDQVDYDYLFLVYCTRNNPFAGDKWTPEHDNTLAQIVIHETDIAKLLPLFNQFLDSSIVFSNFFITSMIELFRKFLYNLQQFLPEDRLIDKYLNDNCSPLYRKNRELLSKWMTELGYDGEISPKHLNLLTVQIRQLLKTQLARISVVLCSNNDANLLMFESWLHQHLPEKSTRIIPFNFNNDNVKLLKDMESAVIIADQKYIPLLKKVCATNNNIIFDLAVYTKEHRLKHICEAIEMQRQQAYLQFISRRLEI
ncbi:helix-turn-helix domain-containing protein [Streptococcus gallinaceus]|uniref:Mga helix-turn-helix domain-containing protein n=1 Tax=Streptococcus gallinaceus TaxID=165758 RepID=A0ABV2JJX0_9STRE